MTAELSSTSWSIHPSFQYYFRPNSTGSKLEIAPEPKAAFRSRELSDLILDLREVIKTTNYNDGVYDRMMELWFKAGFGPDARIQTIYEQLLISADDHHDEQIAHTSIWDDMQRAIQLGQVSEWQFDQQLAEALVRAGIESTPPRATQMAHQALQLFTDIADDLECYREYEEDLTNYHNDKYDYSDDPWLPPTPPTEIIFYDYSIPPKRRKQLALVGVFTHAQFEYLTRGQKTMISKIPVPVGFKIFPSDRRMLPDPLDILAEVEKLQPLFYF